MVNVNGFSNTQITFHHVMKSMAYRKKNTLTMVCVLTMGFYLLFLFQNIKEQLVTTIDRYSLQSDLIISADTPPLSLVMFSLFNVGSPPPTISLSLLDELSNHPEIEYAIPYAYGETHRGIPVIGTSTEGIEQLIQQPENSEKPLAAFIGVNIEKRLGYKINDQITIADGNEPGLEQEYPLPLTIADILPRQNTHYDDTIFVSIEGLKAARQSYTRGFATSWSNVDDISLIDIKLRDRMALLAMEKTLEQSAAQQDLKITVAMPAKELETLNGYLNRAAASLIFMSLVTIGLCLLTLFYALVSNLQERKQEIVLYRTLGMNQRYIHLMAALEPLLIISTAFLMGFLISEFTSTQASEFLLTEWIIN
ncbi:ABC transporter permease [Endozoicomonas sp.]|uniref:ABC transporter permease n=1 Tax=Endozoicomonas sp. TaxID=1892382 RepID=UPI00383BDCEA